jgi:hypothetical protein
MIKLGNGTQRSLVGVAHLGAFCGVDVSIVAPC